MSTELDKSWQIQGFLEAKLEAALDQSNQCYLENLAISHAATASLLMDLHRFDDGFIASTYGSNALTAVLNRSFEDLFVPYVEGDRYLDMEQNWLLSNFQVYLGPFQRAVV
jgi:exocyst complex component 5